MIRIIVADDHLVVRKGITQIISETADMQVVGEAENGPQLLNMASPETCDVVLLDISMPGRSGLEVLKDLKAEHPSLPILILSIHPEEQYAIRALRAGASGYLTKRSAADELISALRMVARNEKYITKSLAEALADYVSSGDDKPRHEILSDREFQVLRLIASGKTISEVGVELNLSVKTISTYRSRILEKMDMQNNAEITHYAIKNNLVD